MPNIDIPAERMSATDSSSAARTIGVTSPFSVATATAMSALPKRWISLPWTWMLTCGTSISASAQALTR